MIVKLLPALSIARCSLLIAAFSLLIAHCSLLTSVYAGDMLLIPEGEFIMGSGERDGRKYPWGNEENKGYANTRGQKTEDEKNLSTSAVGSFQEDVSPYGMNDMC